MTQQDQATQDRFRPETSRGHYLLEVLGILCFVLLVLLIGVDLYQGAIEFGDLWLAPILAFLAYLAADFLSGFVHFLADNFGSYDTPIIGPNFIEPFREHHIDPKGIVGNDFVDANGNNSLASLPFMLALWVVGPSRLRTMGISSVPSFCSCSSLPSLPTSSTSGRTWMSRRPL
jgi:hypothetical protein